MNEWDEAARKAAEEIYSIMRDSFPSMERKEYEHYITRNFSDLRATYEKLVELAAWCIAPVDYDNPEVMNEDYAKFERLKSDPLVAGAIERSKKV